MHRKNTKITVITIAVTLGILSFIAENTYTFNKIVDMNNEWKSYSNYSSEISNHISRVRGQIGYTGFIHNFKNYILRGDPAYADRAEHIGNQAKGELLLISALIKDPKVHDAIGVLQSTIDLYLEKLALARDNNGSIDVVQLDNRVAIDDEPARKALITLDAYQNALLTKQTSLNDSSIVEIERMSRYRLFYTAIIFLLGGGVIYLLVMQDKAVRKMAATIRENDALFDVFPDAALIIDKSGTVIRHNAIASRMLGYSAKGLEGLAVISLIPNFRSIAPNYLSSELMNDAQSEKATENGSHTISDEQKALTKDGTELPIILSISQIQHGRNSLTILAVHDLTERNAALREIDEARAAETAAVAANNAKSAFMATMNHELRTPLNAVIGFAELLERNSDINHDVEKTVQYATTIGESGRHLMRLINQVLDFEKIQAGKFELMEVPFSLAEEVSNLHSAFEVRAKDAHVALTFEGLDSQLTLLGDVLRFRQVLMNLIDNAIKFSEGGEVHVRVQTEKTNYGHIKVNVVISDTGIGIPEEKLDDIFTPFLQSDPTITRKFGGTGLGLSISRTLANLLGGDVAVESKEYEGSTFMAHFVFKDLTNLLSHVNIGGRKRSKEGDPQFDLTALAVDDVETNLDVIEAIARDLGCRVKKTRNGQEAVEFLSANDVDIILMDIHMPVLDGISAAQRIRQLPGLKANIPIFAWTADVSCQKALDQSGIRWEGTIFKPTNRDSIVMAFKGVNAA